MQSPNILTRISVSVFYDFELKLPVSVSSYALYSKLKELVRSLGTLYQLNSVTGIGHLDLLSSRVELEESGFVISSSNNLPGASEVALLENILRLVYHQKVPFINTAAACHHCHLW